jgi:nucleoside-diphosphate-sugar epimerase
MVTKSKILIIGGTGYIGKFMVEAKATAGYPTLALIRHPKLSNLTLLSPTLTLGP